MRGINNSIVNLCILAMLSVLSPKALACWNYTDVPFRDMSRAESIFVVNVKNYSIHFAEETPYYAKLEVEVLDTIFGKRLAGDATFYLIEDNNESLREFLSKGVHIIGIISDTPEYIFFKDGKRQAIPLVVTDSNARLIYNQTCYNPFLLKYSESVLVLVGKYLEKDIKEKLESVK